MGFDKQEFLPKAKSQAPPPPKPAPAQGKANPPPVDPEADPAVQRERALGQYGFNLLQIIEGEYADRTSNWTKAFREVVAAYATAIERRKKTLDEAREERQSEAAIDTLVFSLTLSGSMRFLGAYLQYDVLPKVTIENKQFIYYYDHSPRDIYKMFGLVLREHVTRLPPTQFSKMQAAVFGGIAQDLGNRLVPLTFPSPKSTPYELDSYAGVENLRADLGNLLDASAKVVLTQLREAKKWMNDSTEFGHAWASAAGGNTGIARGDIRKHIEDLMDGWGRKWEFFGMVPQPIHRELLTDAYERSLWATHALTVLEQWKGQGAHERGHRLIKGEVIEDAIVKRLRQLNVVIGKTDEEYREQVGRMVVGSPGPTVEVEGDVDSRSELFDLGAWAYAFLKALPDDVSRRHFPPARPVPLPRLA